MNSRTNDELHKIKQKVNEWLDSKMKGFPDFQEQLMELFSHPVTHSEVQDTLQAGLETIRKKPDKREEVLEDLLRIYRYDREKREKSRSFLLRFLFETPFGLSVPEGFSVSVLGKRLQEMGSDFPVVLMTSGDLALLLGVSRQAIHQAMQKGKIPYQKVGKYGVIKLKDGLEYYLENYSANEK